MRIAETWGDVPGVTGESTIRLWRKYERQDL